ncbi:MAG: hypothetical protein KGH61_01470 [Candidatus Micrarchaeota archaeon]|nr:hypothetical protein [Candidatus Micrarchaeota archaeon]MDE1847600.1 hypothetical protein [Candidatus Micrarchaeota archaeon]MDE1863803.1 hypothetical protein [Candidatus Micrarchaeota archaeon]
MKTIRASDFSLKYTVESAQPLTFIGEIGAEGQSVGYAYSNGYVKVRQAGRNLHCEHLGRIGGIRLVSEIERRFGLRDEMQKVYGAIRDDAFLVESMKRYPGMRITQNDPWETTVCFVVSQFNNVKRIRLIMQSLIQKYGEVHEFYRDDKKIAIRSFPTPTALMGPEIKELMGCGTGFRAKYIKGVAQACAQSFDLARLYSMGYDQAKEELISLPGIGDKVADCILLMGYKKGEAFPVDTWIKRAMERLYFGGKKQSIRKIHEFAEGKWGKYAGYAQQYIFWHSRSIKLS